jgi:hypothetical protein
VGKSAIYLPETVLAWVLCHLVGVTPTEQIKQKLWGGSGLSDGEMEKLKYPPLN